MDEGLVNIQYLGEEDVEEKGRNGKAHIVDKEDCHV